MRVGFVGDYTEVEPFYNPWIWVSALLLSILVLYFLIVLVSRLCKKGHKSSDEDQDIQNSYHYTTLPGEENPQSHRSNVN